jgi:hypothetical protein
MNIPQDTLAEEHKEAHVQNVHSNIENYNLKNWQIGKVWFTSYLNK